MSELLTAQVLREASEAIGVLSPTAEEIVALARERRRRTGRRVMAVVAVAVGVIGAVTCATTRPESSERRPPPPVVRRAPNPVGVPWFADGDLHLASVAVRLPQPESLRALDGGAAYVDRRGRVAFVAPDGVRRPLGRAVAGSGLVVSEAEDWVAWLAPGGSGSAGGEPSLVVHDVATGHRVAERQVPAGAGLVAIDQRRVFYTAGGTSYGWRPEDGDVEEVRRAGLADVQDATRAYAGSGRVTVVQPFFSVSRRWPGVAPVLSPDGAIVLAAAPGSETGRPFRPHLYDTRSGDPVPGGIAADEVAVDATFSADDVVTYLVRRGDDPRLVLRVCEVGTARCTDAAPVPTGADQPTLAH